MESSLIKINKWLYPASWIYGAGVWLRNKMFDWGIYKERSFNLPIICIGNITVGGTGKTPHTEYLIRLLQNRLQVAVLSRGYKRKSKGFVLAKTDTPMNKIGDEPYQMKQKYPNIHMAVDANRCRGIEKLCKENIAEGTEVILLDDAFQHRYVKAGLNILLVDYNRMIGEDKLLPAGRLREPISSKDRADIVIITKCPKQMNPMEFRVLTKQMELYPYQRLYFTSFNYGKLRPLFNQGKEHAIDKIHSEVHILLVSGIASPEQLETDLRAVNKNIHPLSFSDHHNFTVTDLKNIKHAFDKLPEGRRMIVTTEKDAVRLKSDSHLDENIKPYIYVLPIEVTFLQNQEESFNQNIIEYVRKNPRNRSLS